MADHLTTFKFPARRYEEAGIDMGYIGICVPKGYMVFQPFWSLIRYQMWITRDYYIASSMSGQDESNPEL